MKKSILFLSFCTIVLSSLSCFAQLQTPDITDTTTLFALTETEVRPLTSYKDVYKQRLDSIQKIIPLDYNESVQKYIDIYTGRKEMMGKMLGLSEYYFPIFEQALKSYNVPVELEYIPVIESAMNPNAVSRVGATGLWQFMYTTAKGYGLNIDQYEDERKDPIQASYAAAKYFREAFSKLGDWLLAIAAYNCGTGNVTRAIAKANSRDFWEIRPYLPKETRNYVPAFIAAMYVMNCSSKHEISLQKCPFITQTDTIQVNKIVSLPLLAKALNVEEDLLCCLNPSYKKDIVNGTDQSPKRIIIPKVELANFSMVYDVLNNITTKGSTQIVQVSHDDNRGVILF